MGTPGPIMVALRDKTGLDPEKAYLGEKTYKTYINALLFKNFPKHQWYCLYGMSYLTLSIPGPKP